MKIGYLVSQYPSPSHTFIRREISALRRLGLEVVTFSVRRAEALSDDDRTEESRTFYVLSEYPIAFALDVLSTLMRRPVRWLSTLWCASRLRLPGLKNLLMSLVYFAEAMRLARELERRRITHLHNHFANAASNVGLAATRYLRISWSFSVHGRSDFSGPMTPLLRPKVEACRFAVAVSHDGRERASRAAGLEHRGKIHVIRCGIEVERLPAARRTSPRDAGPLVILSVGRLSPEKGHVGLLEAFARVLERGLDARLVLMGGGPEEENIRAAAERLGVASRLDLAGAQPEQAVLAAMARAHVFALSSLVEGLPVVLMEALAMELPVIAPAINGIPELVRHEITGLLFEAGDWEALAAGILRLALDAELGRRVAAAGRELVLREFDVRRSAVPLAALFAGVGSGPEQGLRASSGASYQSRPT